MAATMFGVSDFMSKIGGKGMYAKRNKFTVEITKPVTMNPGGGPMGIEGGVHPSTIEFLVKGVSFPGRSFGTATYRSRGKFALDVPYEMVEEPVDITFLGTNDWAARGFWNDWIDHIQNVDDYASELKAYDKGDTIMLRILRNESPLYIAFEIE